jgi:hypothetical protein
MTQRSATPIIEVAESRTPAADNSERLPGETALLATVRFLIARDRGGVLFDATMLALIFGYPRTAILATIATAGVLDVAGPRHTLGIGGFVKRVHARRKRFYGTKKKTAWRTLTLTLKAIKFEIGLTEKSRDKAWLRVTCERIGIDPPLRYIKKSTDEVGELWELGVPVSPKMNPSILAHDRYAAGIRACVRNKCHGVGVYASNTRGGIAFIRVTRHDITEVDAGPSPLLTYKQRQFTINTPRSIADPLPIGKTAMKRPFHINLMDRSGVGIFGMNGTGKSVLLHTIACHVLTAPDANGRLADLKDGMDGGMYRNADLRYGEDPEDVHDWISEFVAPKDKKSGGEVVTWRRADKALERSKYLQSKGLNNWLPGCGLKADIIIIDEVDGLSPNDQFALAWMINKLRAIGVRVIYATQLPRADTLDKRLASATNVKIAFRCADVTAANVALGAGMAGRGYDASELAVPGYCYVLGAEMQDPVVVRTHNLELPQIKFIASQFPRPAIVESAGSSESVPNLTPDAPLMGGTSPADSQIVRSPALEELPAVEPPPDTRTKPQRAALWNALPGTRAQLAEASGYKPNYVNTVMNEWAAMKKVWSVGGVWRVRPPTEPTSDMS